MFINTRAAQHVLKCIKENSCVTITASAGVGKTAILRHVALQMSEEEYEILYVFDPFDIMRFYNPNQKTLFVIDDLCGVYGIDERNLQLWQQVVERIKTVLQNNLYTKIIAACRLQVCQDDRFKALSVCNTCVCNLLSENICLTKNEKKSIAELYLENNVSEITNYYELYDCFPLLCKLSHDNPNLNIIDFFKNPFSVYEAEIEMLLKEGHYAKYCALALCVMFNNNLREEILTEDVDEVAIIENTCEACRLDKRTHRPILLDAL
ncbi:Hypothetical predicted protein, partial [Mytilus galloprovincialis]